MSPDKLKKLEIIRNKLDTLDNSLIKLIKKRTLLVNEFKNQIVDNRRIHKILSQIRKKSIKNKIDPKITKKIWINMIRAYIDYERRNFKKK